MSDDDRVGVLRDVLGLSASEIADLRADKIVIGRDAYV